MGGLTGEVCRHGGYTHDGALCRRVAPRLVVGWKHAHVTAAHKLLVVHAEQRVGVRQELRVEHHLWRGEQTRQPVSAREHDSNLKPDLTGTGLHTMMDGSSIPVTMNGQTIVILLNAIRKKKC